MSVRVLGEIRTVASRLARAFGRPPTWRSLVPLLLYAPLAALVAVVSDVAHWQPAGLAGGWPLLLLLFPVLPEELFFRGVLIVSVGYGRLPHRAILISSLAFVLWHPLNALTINPAARGFFLDPAFLGIVGLLGLACGYSYALSRSLWSPILIHWLTVVAWVGWLGGRNLALGV